MRYTIYLIKNNINGLVYVGCTSMPVAMRWDNHRPNQRTAIGRAMREHGRKSFEFSVLATAGSRLDATQAERKWIADLRANQPRHGYNCPGRAN